MTQPHMQSNEKELRRQLRIIRTALNAAEAILSTENEAESSENFRIQNSAQKVTKRDETLFRGIFLSDKGVEFVRQLYESGHTIDQVATTLNISRSAAAARRRDWLRTRSQRA